MSTSENDTLNAKTLTDVYNQLVMPFPPELVELRPGATSKDGKRALALAYVDMRDYQDRLDEVCGPDGWSVEYRPWGERAVICTLTILGITREDVGEADPKDENSATIAVAQAFKRTCTGFGLGRYLYNLPQYWADYDNSRKVFINPAQIVREMYIKAGIKCPSILGAKSPEKSLPITQEQKAEIGAFIDLLLEYGVFRDMQEAVAHFKEETGTTSRDLLTEEQAQAYISLLQKVYQKAESERQKPKGVSKEREAFRG